MTARYQWALRRQTRSAQSRRSGASQRSGLNHVLLTRTETHRGQTSGLNPQVRRHMPRPCALACWHARVDADVCCAGGLLDLQPVLLSGEAADRDRGGRIRRLTHDSLMGTKMKSFWNRSTCRVHVFTRLCFLFWILESGSVDSAGGRDRDVPRTLPAVTLTAGWWRRGRSSAPSGSASCRRRS